MEPINYLVRVSCMTFNQASYIEDAMNGFTMQETKFPFVCIIVDDASTDGEQEVIEGYLKEHFDLEDKAIVQQEETDDYVRTFARHKSNYNCYFQTKLREYLFLHKQAKILRQYFAQASKKQARYPYQKEGQFLLQYIHK